MIETGNSYGRDAAADARWWGRYRCLFMLISKYGFTDVLERGLTTAASIWVTAAVGSAAGAGLLVLAALTTGIYFVVTLVLPIIRRSLPLGAAGTSHVAGPLSRWARYLALGAERGDPARLRHR